MQVIEADVAQLVEQPIRNRQVTGSSPVVGSIKSGTYRAVSRRLLHTCCTKIEHRYFLRFAMLFSSLPISRFTVFGTGLM
jgi:hypothetical protein